MFTQEAIDQFCVAKAVVWTSYRTRAKYLGVLTRFAAVYPEGPETPGPIESFLAGLQLAPQSLHTYYRVLRTFYGWYSRRHDTIDPFLMIQAPSAQRPRPRILSLEELQQLLSLPDHPPPAPLLLNVLADTGIRVGEAANLHRANITPDSLIVTGKTGAREVPCSPDICDDLRTHTGRIFPYLASSLTHMVQRAFRRAGFSGAKVGPHTLRHTFATLWGGSDADLQAILGHRAPEMTLWYRQFRIERAKRDHARYSPRNRSRDAAQSTLFAA